MWSRLRDDPWSRLGLLGALFGLSVLLVHVPASLWAGNAAEFDSSPWSILAFGTVAVVAGLLAVWILLALLPGRARAVLACVLCAVALAEWIYAYFLVGDMTVLTGQHAPMDFSTVLGIWELPVAAAMGSLVAVAIGRARAPATLAFAILNLALVAGTVATVISARGSGTGTAEADTSSVFRFSPSENVLIVLLDGLQSDVANDILTEDQALRTAFDGFHFYKDVVSPAPTTFLSLPAIHSGEVYQPPDNLRDYFSRAIEERSFMNRFAQAGYDTALVNPIEGICPAKVATCVTAAQLLRSSGAQLRREALGLLDLSLFRVSPVWLKRWIYNDGRWLVSGQLDLPRDIVRIFEGYELFREVARRFTLNDGTPTLKFLHTYSTHTPYVLNGDCRTVEGISLERNRPQSRCALLAVTGLFDRLKRENVYDGTVILLLADHGTDPGLFPRDRRGARGGSGATWVSLAGAANPVFLLKPRESRGALRLESSAAQLSDVGATLCTLTGACEMPLGVPAWQAPADRPRRFHDYVWRHSYWKTRTIPTMASYDIRGPLWNPASWRRPGAVGTYRLGDEIHFGVSGNGEPYLQYGWHAPGPWGSWTSDRVAHVLLHLAGPVEAPLELTALVVAFVPPDTGRQEVGWVVNGHVLDTWSFTDARPAERRLRIPRVAVEGRLDLMLQLRISTPMSPRDAGTGKDPRRLGLALGKMKLVRSGERTP